MGAWGYSIFENDAAQEVVQRWDEWIEGTKAIGYDEAIKRFFDYWGDAVNYGDPITNSEIIALLGLHLENKIEIPSQLKKAAIQAISRELEEQELNSWDDPLKRKSALNEILKAINAKPVKIRKPISFKDPALAYRNIDAAKRDLLKRFKEYKQKKQNWHTLPWQKLPSFLSTLYRYMEHRVWEKDYHIAEQARIERTMMLAWCLAASINMSETDFLDLISKIISSDKRS